MINILNGIYKIFFDMAPYLLLGLLFVAILHLFFSKEKVIKHVGTDNIWSIIKASLLGVPLPLCSCGVIPSSVFLAKNGASKGAVVSFLVSTPQTGVDSILATYGMMGLPFAIFRPLAAFILGIGGGIAAKLFNTELPIAKEKQPPVINIKPIKKPTALNRLQETISYAFGQFLDDIAAQFVVGIILAGIITALIPDNFFKDTVVNSGILGMLMVIAVGTPMYICATASIPVAVTLILKGFSPGVAFVFLTVGPATNAATFSIILKALGKKTALVYLFSIIIGAVVMGLVFDQLLGILNIDVVKTIHQMHHGHAIMPHSVKIVLGYLFLLILLTSLFRKFIWQRYFAKTKKQCDCSTPEDTMQTTTTLNIEGMNCGHCSKAISDAILKVNGVTSALVSHEKNNAIIEGNFSLTEIVKIITDLGYTVRD